MEIWIVECSYGYREPYIFVDAFNNEEAAADCVAAIHKEDDSLKARYHQTTLLVQFVPEHLYL